MDALDTAIAHFGVKGMQWGVRKDDSGGGRGKVKRGLTKAGVALDASSKVVQEGEKKLIFLPQAHRNKAAARTHTQVLAEAAALNRDPKYKGKDLKTNPSLKRSYFKQLEDRAKTTYANELNISRTEAWGEVLGVNTNSATTQMRISAAKDRIRHADGDDREILLELNFTLDSLGQVTDISVPDQYIAHDGTDDELVLVHYGVKGMQWGVRKTDRATRIANRAAPSTVKTTLKPAVRGSQSIKVQNRSGGRVTAKGGARNVASEDAVKVAVSKQKAKASSTNALSNKELQDAVNRMNLEKQYVKLAKDEVKRTRGKRFAQALLGVVGDAVTAEVTSAAGLDNVKKKK